MRRGIKSAWVMAALVMLGAMTNVGGGTARAGTIGLTITGGFMPVTTDPPYIYFFDVNLDPGFEVKAQNLFTVFDLNGVNVGSLSSQPSNLPAVAWNPNPELSTITWTFLGDTPIPNTNPVGSNIEVPLGHFQVQTTENFPDGPPVPFGTVVPYFFTITSLATGGDVSGSGTIILEPEPSSFVLLALGAAALPALAARRKRRRLARTA